MQHPSQVCEQITPMQRHQEPAETRKRKADTLHPPSSKRRRLPTQACFESRDEEIKFWDSLSKIWLTRPALKELRRRTKSRPDQSVDARRPRTRAYTSLLQQTRSSRVLRSTVTASRFLTQCSSESLRQIKLSARRGGLDLSKLRGHPYPRHTPQVNMSSTSNASRPRRDLSASSQAQSEVTPGTTITTTVITTTTRTTNRVTEGELPGKITAKKSLPKDPNYEQKLIDGAVYPEGYDPDGHRMPLPADWEDLKQRLRQPRPSLSPSMVSEEDFQNFADANLRAKRESEVKDPVVPLMFKAMNAQSTACKDRLFTNFSPIVDGITQAKPDYYYGARHEQIDFKVRRRLHERIIPSPDSPAVPNFSMEVKGPAGSGVEAMRQVCHNGALGARAVHSLDTYGQARPAYDNKVKSISAIFSSGLLTLHGHSVAAPDAAGSKPRYHMHQISGWYLPSSHETFLQGATALKNAIDITEGYRNAAIQHANAIARGESDNEEETREHEDEGAIEETVENNVIPDSDNDTSEQYEDAQENLAALPSPQVSASHIIHPPSSSTPSTARPTAEDRGEQEDESETSLEELAHCPPSKRSSAKSHGARRRHRRRRRRDGYEDDRS